MKLIFGVTFFSGKNGLINDLLCQQFKLPLDANPLTKSLEADLLYTIKANTPKEEIVRQLREHLEIEFVSPVGIDFAGNDTDEKIPVRLFIKDIDEFYAGRAVQG